MAAQRFALGCPNGSGLTPHPARFAVACGGAASYAAFDFLLLPAKAEPYGMVISEAMAARVPVLISDVCGAAAHVTAVSGAVLPLSASLDTWVAALDQQLSRRELVPQFERSWRKVAEEYEAIYSEILAFDLKRRELMAG